MFTFRNAQYEYNLFDLYAAPRSRSTWRRLPSRAGSWSISVLFSGATANVRLPICIMPWCIFQRTPPMNIFPGSSGSCGSCAAPPAGSLRPRLGQMQVFRTAEKEPVPIETDPVVQMETIHAAMRVRDSVLFAGSLIFYILLLLPLLLLTRSAGNWAAWFRLFLPVLLLYILPCCITLVSHLLWYRSARQTAQNENRLQAPKGNRRLNAVHTILALICLFLFLFSVIAERNYYLATLDRCCHPRDDLSIGSLFQAPSPAATTRKTDCCRSFLWRLRF